MLAGVEPWRFVTTAFVHSPTSLLHIGFNMYILYAFGPILERTLGRAKFLLSYLLCAVGGSLADVVRITAWLTSLDEYREYSRVRGERFGKNLPASAAVQVAGLLQGALIEIDAVAFIPD